MALTSQQKRDLIESFQERIAEFLETQTQADLDPRVLQAMQVFVLAEKAGGGGG